MGKLVDLSYRKIQWIVRDTANGQRSTVDSGIVWQHVSNLNLNTFLVADVCTRYPACGRQASTKYNLYTNDTYVGTWYIVLRTLYS
jgi:hypothetical protein